MAREWWVVWKVEEWRVKILKVKMRSIYSECVVFGATSAFEIRP